MVPGRYKKYSQHSLYARKSIYREIDRQLLLVIIAGAVCKL